MWHLWRVRPDLQQAFDPREAAGRIGFAQWFLTTGVAESDLAWLIDPPQRDPTSPAPPHPHAPRPLPPHPDLSSPDLSRPGADLVGYDRKSTRLNSSH